MSNGMFRRSRRAIAPGIDQLESRQLLSAATVLHQQHSVAMEPHRQAADVGPTPAPTATQPDLWLWDARGIVV